MGKHQRKKTKTNRSHSTQEEFGIAYDFHNQGKTEIAEKLYRKILIKDPGHSNALHLLGVIALERNDYDKALDLIKRAIVTYPKAAPYYNNLALAYQKKGLVDEAVKAFQKAFEIDSNYSEAHNNLGTLLKDRGDLAAAASCFEAAIRINPGFATAYYNLGTVLCDQGHVPEAIAAYKKALSIHPGFVQAHSNLLYTLHFSDSMSPVDVFSEHQVWEQAHARAYKPVQGDFPNDRDPLRKLNIGYVSPDFRTHSVAFFLEDVIAHHNRKQVQVFCYSSTDKKDDFTRRFSELADVWRDISTMSDDEAARLVRADQIDILVDLAGHTRNSRILIFARKPAPVQVTWLGYPDTTGLQTMDYRLTDVIADPPGLADQLATEKLVRLDGGFLCYKPPGESFTLSPPPVVKTGTVTFGSFNNNSKISERVISVWARILNRTPDSMLKLKSRSFSDAGTRKHILERFEHHGIPAERIVFENYMSSLLEHFMLYGGVDIALDTFPYNGTTTTCEALWMGVPVIALSGDSHLARVGASLLHHVGLYELLASSEEDYVEKALALSRDIPLLSELRSGLRELMAGSPLLDASAFSARIEDAFRGMWKKWVEESSIQSEISRTSRDAELFEKNLQALRVSHPLVETLLDEKAPFGIQVRLAESGVPNLYVSGEDGQARPVYPEKDPLNDLASLKKTIQNVKGKVLCVMGAGLFIHAPAIVDTVGKTNLIVFFEAHPAVFRAALMNLDLVKVLSHPNVRLAIGGTADPYLILNEERDKLFTSDLGEFVQYDRVVSLASDWYKEKRKTFEQFFKRIRISLNTVASSGKLFFENSFRNLLALSESRPLDDLGGLFKGKPAILVAAGPSLSKNIHHLKNIKDKALIIAADAALAPLMACGIKPHMIVSVDNNDFTFEKLAPYIDDLHDVDLVYIPNVTSKIVNGMCFKSKYYTFADPPSQNLFNRLLNRNANALEDIHSVIHLAMATAQTAGCDPIIFTGLDLAYAGTQDHVAGTILNWGNNRVSSASDLMVESIHGDMIPSSHGFVGMIEICQRMIQLVPDRVYIDATEGGAKIIGTKIQPLAMVLENHCIQSMGPYETMCPHSAPVRLEDLLNELIRLNHDLSRSLKQIERYANEQARVEQFVGKQPGGIDPGLLPEHITGSVRTMDKINTGLENDHAVSFVKSIMTEAYDQYKELGLDVMESGSSRGQRFAAALTQQAFVQGIRKAGLEFLSKELGKAISIVEMILSMERPETLSDQGLFDQIAQLIDQGFLIRAATFLAARESSPEKNYCLGCIHIKQGQIQKGENFFRKALDQDEGILPRIAAFKQSMVTEWLKKDAFPTYRKICIDRVLALEPGNTDALRLKQEWLVHRAVGLIQNGCYETVLDELLIEGENAHSTLEHVVSLNPAAALLWDNMGDAWFGENNFSMALIAYERCLTAFPDRMDVLQKIGDVYKEMGQLDAAEMAYGVVLARMQR